MHVHRFSVGLASLLVALVIFTLATATFEKVGAMAVRSFPGCMDPERYRPHRELSIHRDSVDVFVRQEAWASLMFLPETPGRRGVADALLDAEEVFGVGGPVFVTVDDEVTLGEVILVLDALRERQLTIVLTGG